MTKRTLEQTFSFIHKAADHNGWSVNPDTDFAQTLAEGLTVNVNRYGYYLCPCRDGDGSREEDRDIICPCVYASPDIDEYGRCFCALFLSPEHSAGAAEITQIPERRTRGF